MNVMILAYSSVGVDITGRIEEKYNSACMTSVIPGLLIYCCGSSRCELIRLLEVDIFRRDKLFFSLRTEILSLRTTYKNN